MSPARGRPQFDPSGSPVPYGGKPAFRAGLTVGARFPRPDNVARVLFQSDAQMVQSFLWGIARPSETTRFCHTYDA